MSGRMDKRMNEQTDERKIKETIDWYTYDLIQTNLPSTYDSWKNYSY